ncbi:MAG TPA: hypothetical protein VGA78_16515 [Gemmatimonadales bacterium]
MIALALALATACCPLPAPCSLLPAPLRLEKTHDCIPPPMRTPVNSSALALRQNAQQQTQFSSRSPG